MSGPTRRTAPTTSAALNVAHEAEPWGRMPWHDSIYIAQGNAAKLWNERVKAQPNPRPVAHWIQCSPDDDTRYECSRCGCEVSNEWDYDDPEMFSFCPVCGAVIQEE